MAKGFLSITVLTLSLLLLGGVSEALAQAAPQGEPTNLQSASFQSRCQNLPPLYPECADTEAECGSDPQCGYTPFNCIFLQEPIGGTPGFDLYKVTCHDNPFNGEPNNPCPGRNQICDTTLWYGEAIPPGGNEVGPFQAILTFEEGKEYQGPFGLLYNYLGLIYTWLSGIIIAFVVLISVIGGIRMSTSAGNEQTFSQGRDMIIKALVGMVLWFTASVILYTINPTFFAF